MKVRIRFEKDGVMVYVGHLDLMRYFQKAMRRAHIPMRYSEGFSPHQIMSFAAPLGVGITSVGEYMDIEITKPVSSSETLATLNATMVDGIRLTSFRELPDDAKKAMAIVDAAEYYVTVESELTKDELRLAVSDFMDRESIIVTKKSKKSERQIDLKPGIYQMDVCEDDSLGNCIHILCNASSGDNLKPDFIVQTMLSSVEHLKLHVHRLDMYTLIDEKLVSLGEMGHDIEI